MVVLWRGLSAAGGVEGERKKERERERAKWALAFVRSFHRWFVVVVSF